jgi:hypothetical protein
MPSCSCTDVPQHPRQKDSQQFLYQDLVSTVLICRCDKIAASHRFTVSNKLYYCVDSQVEEERLEII